jgi:hypothetical protein
MHDSIYLGQSEPWTTGIGNSPAEGGWIVVNENRRGVVAALKCNVPTAVGSFDVQNTVYMREPTPCILTYPDHPQCHAAFQ